MTVQELRKIFNDFGDRYGVEKAFPSPYEIDSETFANVCQYIFNEKAPGESSSQRVVLVAIGPNSGIYFKRIELVLKEKKE